MFNDIRKKFKKDKEMIMKENTNSSANNLGTFQEWIFSAIFYFAAKDGAEIPTTEKYVLAEFAEAVLEYSGKRCDIVVDKFGWEKIVNDKISSILSADEKIPKELKKILSEIIVFKSCVNQGNGNHPLFCDLFRANFNGNRSWITFSLPASFKRKVRQEIFPVLIGDKEILSHCEAIGKIFKRKIDRDAKYIKKHLCS